MGKRIVALFTAILLLMTACAVRVMGLTFDQQDLGAAAARQQRYTLTIPAQRGCIYDRRYLPLTNAKQSYLLAVSPKPAAAAALSKVLPRERLADVYRVFQKGMPFTLSVDAPVQADGILCFPQAQRYRAPQPAAHLIGYLDGEGKGVAGVEKAFEQTLSPQNAKTRVTYTVNALRHPLYGEAPQVQLGDAAVGDVVLTLDLSLQQLAEQALQQAGIRKGAAVVLQAGTAEILACASAPSYDPAHPAAALQEKDASLLNRALQPYNVGSPFKLVTAAAALESGVDPDVTTVCTGACEAGGRLFHCYDGKAHGVVNMRAAIAQSCNSYFIRTAQKLPQGRLLQTARQFGFGQALSLAEGLRAKAGALPSEKALRAPRALANFSFGQGDLSATPLTVAAMVNAIASGGTYTQPQLYKGKLVKGRLQGAKPAASHRACSARTANLLCDAMRESVHSGTGAKGRPAAVSAAAKTGTAQTGRSLHGEEALISWYVGFFPVEKPAYVVAILAEDGTGGGATCGPAFRLIADSLYGKKH